MREKQKRMFYSTLSIYVCIICHIKIFTVYSMPNTVVVISTRHGLCVKNMVGRDEEGS